MFNWQWERHEFINYNMYPSRFASAALAVLLLTACDKPSDKAKREYQLMLRSGASLDDQCAKLKEVASAYLTEENRTEYQMADIEADMKCSDAELKRLRY